MSFRNQLDDLANSTVADFCAVKFVDLSRYTHRSQRPSEGAFYTRLF